MNQKVRILPINQHFENISALRNAILDYEKTRIFQIEISNPEFFETPNNKFEKVRISPNNFVLIPTAPFFSSLYRGQTKRYSPCLPTLQRDKLDEDQLFLENLKTTEFELLLKTHPVVQDIFIESGFVVDYSGLAQHYGLKTNMLDLTSDFDIAMFFATCNYDAAADRYFPKKDSGLYEGVLYAHSTIYDLVNVKLDIFSCKLNVIGLQPFKRPATQKGFSLRLNRGDIFNATEYTFTYTLEDSLHYFELFDNGNALWVIDELAHRAKQIRDTKEYSLNGLTLAKRRYAPKGKGVCYYQDYLHKNDYRNKSEDQLTWAFTEADREKIRLDWIENYDEEFWNSIVTKTLIKGGIKYNERDIESYSTEILFRHMQGGKVLD